MQAAGTTVEVGSEVRLLKVGQRVVTSGAAGAHTRIESRQAIGRVLLIP